MLREDSFFARAFPVRVAFMYIVALCYRMRLAFLETSSYSEGFTLDGGLPKAHLWHQEWDSPAMTKTESLKAGIGFTITTSGG